MENYITIIARFDLQEGKLREFEELFQMGIEAIKEKEPGVVHFNLYVSPDECSVCSFETYKDSGAVLKHFEISEKRIEKILDISEVRSVDLYGAANQELKDFLSQFGTNFYKLSLGYQIKE